MSWRMKTVFVAWIAVCLFLCPADNRAFENGDVQYWSFVQIQKNFGTRWKFLFNEDMRWGNHASELYFYRPEIGVVFQATHRVSLSLCYKYLHNKETGAWKTVSVPHVNLIFNFKISDVAIMNRNRMEFMDYPDKPDFWRYRGIVFFTAPITIPIIKSKPYVGDELFYHFNNDHVKYNRIYFGLSTPIGKNVKLDTYYFLHHIHVGPSWNVNHVFGNQFTYTF